MGKNPAFPLCWGELEKLGNLKCKRKQTSLNEPENFKLKDLTICMPTQKCDGWVSGIRGDMNLSRSTGVVSLVSCGRVKGSPIL